MRSYLPRIEIRCFDDGFVVSKLDYGLGQATHAHRDDALYTAMQWCAAEWANHRRVDIAEYGPRPEGRLRWSAVGVGSLQELQDLAECARDAAALAERAIERTVDL